MTALRTAPTSIGSSSPQIPRYIVVKASTSLTNGKVITLQYVLDPYLGNDNGSFSTTHKDFSFTARNVRISNDRLCADLVNIEGDTKAADVGLQLQYIQEPEGWTHCLIVGDDCHRTPRRIVPSVVLGLGDPCRHLQLEGSSQLLAKCPLVPWEKYVSRTFNLDFCLGNRDGSFDIDGHKFSLSARNVRLDGTILSAELRTLSHEWKSDKINLQRIVCCSKGRLLAVKESRRLCSQAPLHHETPPIGNTEQQMSLVACPLYTSLAGHQNVIRVCYIESGKWSDPVRCRMVTRFIDQEEDYMCLSYVWGDMQDAFTIEVNSHPVSVSKNLWYALRRLRWYGTAGALWIDALCINQDDVQERSAQVFQMAKIYATAEQVIIWLGALSKSRSWWDSSIELEEEEFSGFLRSLGNNVDVQEATEEVTRAYSAKRKITAPPLDSMIIALMMTLYRFVDLPWFHRTWTVQEYILARRSIFVFGGQAVNTDALANVYTTLNAFATSLKTDSRMQNHFDQHLQTTLGPIMLRLNHLACMADLSRIACSDQASSKELAMDAALSVLQMCRSRKCSDPRDKLLAFAKVASNALGFVHADYSISATDIFLRFTLNVIQQMGNLDIWTLVECARDDEEPSKVEGLPTWVVDWTVEGRHAMNHLFHKRNLPTTSQSYSLDFTVGKDGSVLIVQGTKFDVVSKTTTDAYGVKPQAFKLGQSELTPWIRFLGLTSLDNDAGRSVAWDRFARLLMHDQFPTSAADGGFYIPTRKDEHSRWRIATAEDKGLFYEWAVKEQEYHGIDTAPKLSAELRVVVDLVYHIARGRKLFQSVGGRLGLCPGSAQAGDVLFHIAGSRWPVLLRPDLVARDHACHTTTYQLIGTCYVSDISEELVEQALRLAEQVRIR